MKKVIAFIILIAIAALLIINPSIYNRRNNEAEDPLYDQVIEENEIIPLAESDSDLVDEFIAQLQQSPEQLLTFNAMIMKVMYQTEIEDDVLKRLMNLQRRYYHTELLEINPENLHFANLKAEIEKAREGESWIVEYKVDTPMISEVNPNVAVVLVTFIPNSIGKSTDIYQQYLLERIDGLWYIKGWIGLSEDQVYTVD